MRNVVISMDNPKLADTVGRALQAAGMFKVYRSYASTIRELLTTCKIMRADMLLMDVTEEPGVTVPERLMMMTAVRDQLPLCRMVLFCKEDSGEEPSALVRDVKRARDTFQIDTYIYTSMPPEYVSALLESL